MLSRSYEILVDPRPWKAVDGGTSGPLNSLLISAFLCWVSSRDTFWSTCWAASDLPAGIVAYLTLRRLDPTERQPWARPSGLRVRRLYPLALPALQHRAVAHLVFDGWLLISLRCWMMLPGRRRGGRLALLFLAGLVLGAAPWCKLQAAPITASLGLLLLASIFRNYQCLAPVGFNTSKGDDRSGLWGDSARGRDPGCSGRIRGDGGLLVPPTS